MFSATNRRKLDEISNDPPPPPSALGTSQFRFTQQRRGKLAWKSFSFGSQQAGFIKLIGSRTIKRDWTPWRSNLVSYEREIHNNTVLGFRIRGVVYRLLLNNAISLVFSTGGKINSLSKCIVFENRSKRNSNNNK